ncbi:dihydroxy-acid dehydratase [Microbacterium sulfonylureivorans]|uniref:dihydroxy-acid dehydratase n=1 Tax=Microbacterium sulfonylureivorans TaxID=2486854 RepID=UPI00197C3A7F|nr:dihydroxy-acid dehydratase [Microbacterium sulfonylureivorans]
MLRSNFEEGTTRWAVRRAQWRALGISDDEMLRPKIAVVNSSSSLSSCYGHLDETSRVVQEAIREAGGLAFEVRTTAPSDFVTSAGREARYLLPTRDLIVNEIEVMVEGAQLDGIVCLSSCDKTTPAHLMALGRLNLPSLVVIGGYQGHGFCAGAPVDIDDVYESVGAVAAGTMTVDELTDLTENAIVGPGVCAGLGTANSMHMVAEALGMALPGSAPVLAASPRMYERAEAAGRRIVELIREDVRARDVITAAAIDNALRVVVAVGGSINTIRHITAIAAETELPIDVVARLSQLQGEVPLLARVRPNGAHRVADLERAGGCAAVLAQLGSSIDGSALSVAGGTIAEHLPPADAIDAAVVRPIADPADVRGGIAVVRGNLAPDGALVKLAAVPRDRVRFEGPARVYETESAAMADVRSGAIRSGDVLVLRGMGPRGGPGTVFAAGLVAALVGARLSAHVAVVTDGELSGLNSGMTVGQVMPEAAEGGPLAAVEDGDRIFIDLAELAVSVDLIDETIAERLARLATVPLPEAPRGWLSMYRELVAPIYRGAVLVPPPAVTTAGDS